ncbi:hypothetical protein D5S17_19120 [Pseudonocardiaceae bacterium YIM PH 21723]|nr:hypothetical protein D5S17_19120 [Pseudonocardiaceae bacterium YIM PH 21723]
MARGMGTHLVTGGARPVTGALLLGAKPLTVEDLHLAGRQPFGLLVSVDDEARRHATTRHAPVAACPTTGTDLPRHGCARAYPVPGLGGAMDVARATLLILANRLVRGRTDTPAAVIDLLLDCVAHDIVPVLPETVLSCAGGPYRPLSYVVSMLTGRGTVRFRGAPRPALGAMQDCGLEPVPVELVDQPSLLDSNAHVLALAALALCEATEIAAAAEVCAVLAGESTVDPRTGVLRAAIEQARCSLETLLNDQSTVDLGGVIDSLLSALAGVADLLSGLRDQHRRLNPSTAPCAADCVSCVTGATAARDALVEARLAGETAAVSLLALARRPGHARPGTTRVRELLEAHVDPSRPDTDLAEVTTLIRSGRLRAAAGGG